MLGSFDEAEDHVQEVFLRAWRSRGSFQGRLSARTWLYRIATNACLDTLRRDARRATGAPLGIEPSAATMPWVQPYPDALLDELAADQPDPEATAVSRETISLAFLAAIQLLPPRQRAVLILREVLTWPASEVAALIETTVPAVNSALQRAHATLRHRWPGGRLDRAPAAEPDREQSRLLQRYIAAHEQADPEALIAVLHEDVRLSISPAIGQWMGRDQVARALRADMNTLGCWRLLPITANGQPGVAGYLRRRGDGVPPVRPRRAPHRARPANRYRRLRTTIDVPSIRPARQPVYHVHTDLNFDTQMITEAVPVLSPPSRPGAPHPSTSKQDDPLPCRGPAATACPLRACREPKNHQTVAGFRLYGTSHPQRISTAVEREVNDTLRWRSEQSG